MIARLLAFVVMVWLLGFLWFSISLPGPDHEGVTDGVIVPTGGSGRIDHGVEILREKKASAMLVTGVDPDVRPKEFAVEYDVSADMMNCCVTLDFTAVDTRSNAAETARWVEERGYRSVRLVTTDWHMRRAYNELRQSLPDTIRIVVDAVPSAPTLGMLFLEYNKLLVSRAVAIWPSGESTSPPSGPESELPTGEPRTQET